MSECPECLELTELNLRSCLCITCDKCFKDTKTLVENGETPSCSKCGQILNCDVKLPFYYTIDETRNTLLYHFTMEYYECLNECEKLAGELYKVRLYPTIPMLQPLADQLLTYHQRRYRHYANKLHNISGYINNLSVLTDKQLEIATELLKGIYAAFLEYVLLVDNNIIECNNNKIINYMVNKENVIKSLDDLIFYNNERYFNLFGNPIIVTDDYFSADSVPNTGTTFRQLIQFMIPGIYSPSPWYMFQSGENVVLVRVLIENNIKDIKISIKRLDDILFTDIAESNGVRSIIKTAEPPEIMYTHTLSTSDKSMYSIKFAAIMGDYLILGTYTTIEFVPLKDNIAECTIKT